MLDLWQGTGGKTRCDKGPVDGKSGEGVVEYPKGIAVLVPKKLP